jgi:hypothetical protein
MKKYIILNTLLFVSIISFSQIECKIDKDNLKFSLLGHWKLDGDGSDNSGNGKDGNIVEAKPTEDRFGNSNSALKFDGENDYVKVTDILNAKTTYTISGWYKSDILQGGSFIYLGVNGGCCGCDGVGVGQGNNGTWFTDGNYLVAGGCNGLNWLGTDYELPPIGTWNHFALVKETGKMILYINGKSAHYYNVGDANFQSNDIYFGAASPGGDYAFKGDLDDIFFYDRSLTPDEINQLYFTDNGITLELLFNDKKVLEIGKSLTISTKDEYSNYQWYLDNQPILGEKSREIIITKPGNYSVNVTSNSCDSKSPTIHIIEADKISNCNLPNTIPKVDLIGYYPFCGNAKDISGNNNNGIISGAKLTNDRFGNVNSAYSFNGNQDFILIENAIKKLNTLTISGWYNSSAIQGASFVYVGINSPNLGCNGFGVGQGKGDWISEGNNLHCCSSCSGGWRSADFELPAINTWNHFSLTKLEDEYCVYINGKLIKKFSAPNESNITNLIFLGAASSLGDYSFQGILDDIAIYNRALNEGEIKQIFERCINEPATSANFNSILLKTGNSIALTALPQGGIFKGSSIENNQFVPSKAKIGLNKVQYSFTNSQGCYDSTLFTIIVADTLNTDCKKYDTITVTNTVTKYETITMTDTVSILKINLKLTTGINANKFTSMSLFPNPTSDILHIEVGDVKSLEGYRYRILDALGKEVYNELVKNAITEIPLKTLGVAGIYQFEVIDQNNSSIQSNKIVLQ